MSRALAEELVAVAKLRARISTPRLTLIPLESGHAESMFAFLSDAALYEYMGGGPPPSVAEVRDTYARLESRQSPDGVELWLNWMLGEAATGSSVGWLQATVTARHADLAWVVGVSWQRRGYATEAARAVVSWLRDAGVRVFRAKIHPSHAASQRVAGNIGLLRTAKRIDDEELWMSQL